MEMMAGISRLAAAYGLDVWVWHPAMDMDYSDARTVESALEEWGQVFARATVRDGRWAWPPTTRLRCIRI